ncbi:PAS domain-containing sensor histidine kinase [Devosia sp. 1566]|uniref:hybrid sensor histidine kinase/response regulator n=1 Tax=Devosia sp. 1566 TaxID=2499144 RepID=UPI0019D11FE9|nr:PAS domain-containing sensor histidine kinase [Devosia sp. 1566]
MIETESQVTTPGSDHYQLLVSSIVDYAIYMLDRNGTVVSWNAGAQRFKGYEASEIIGHHFSRFYTEEDKATNLPARALRTAAEEGKFEQEGWRVRKDGTRMWAHVVIDPIRSPTGELIGFAKVTRDLSERKAAETALRESEEQFRLLVQSVTDYALYQLSPEGTVSSWNAGAQRIKGYSAEEIIGQHFSRFYTPEDQEIELPRIALETATREGRFEKEGWRVRKDGSRFWAHVVIDPIRNHAGNIVGFAKVTRDNTERREAQRALDEAREAFFQSQKSEALGQLTGGVAHDFNNLLMVIQSSLELAQKRLPDDPKLRRLIGNALQGAQRGASLTQRMLAFARKQELNPESVDVPQLVRGILDLLERSLGPSLDLVTEFAATLRPARADANQLELAILNLVVNARDAMPGGGIIRISAKSIDVVGAGKPMPPGRYVRITVEDNGEGMDAATLARATEPFFTTKGVGKGTGLGLSMVKGMVEQSGGRLVITSEKGTGTTAQIWLPEAAAETTLDTATADEQQSHPTEPAKKPVVLVVDDDALVLGNVADMLEDLGYSPILAGSGAEALKVLATGEPIDMMLTDYAMPNMTGLQLVREARSRRPDLPVVLASGFVDLAGEESIELPRLAKPFRQTELAKAVSAVIEAS